MRMPFARTSLTAWILCRRRMASSAAAAASRSAVSLPCFR